MRRREARALRALIDAVVAPEPPLPPVRQTDALPAFATWLERAPRANRAAVRALLAALELAALPARGRRFSALARRDRLELLAALDRTTASRAPFEALRSAAAVSYYGDAGVLRVLGHDPAARVREARGRRHTRERREAAA